VKRPVAGIVLAGGKSSRMGGIEKCLLPLQDKPLLAFVLAKLKPQCAAICINANGDAARFAGFNLPVVSDTQAGQPGPLAGILAGMEWAGREGMPHIVTVASDTPFLPRNLVTGLIAMAELTGRDIVLARSLGRDHPVFGYWPVALADDLKDFLAQSDNLSVRAFAVGRHDAAYAEFPAGNDFDPFFNINTPDDLETAREMLRRDLQ
jgi:molybdopterin-guanine dinucleotide biosynthesis protein A